MNKTSFILLFFLLLMTSFSSIAQRNFKVTGKVVSASDGQGLPGATVIIKGTQIGTVSDFDGIFSINIDKEKDVLVFSMIGFVKKEFSKINDSNLKVVLTEETQNLEDVLVVGYGVQKKASSVGAIAQTKGEELLKVGAVTNISSALAGMLPGVTSIAKSGEPGLDQNDILIRGRSTWVGDNSPLILVDGVERSMNGVDPNEVESVSVLKDASATAVFGVKGANGVILITTKRGSIKAPTVSLSANFGMKEQTFDFDYNDPITLFGLNNENNMRERSWSSVITQDEIAIFQNGSDPYYHPYYTWQDLTVKDYGYTQNYNVNVNGGNEKAKYFVSVGYIKDGDIYKTEVQPEYDPRYQYDRYNYRSNIDYNISKTTELSVNLSGEIGLRQRPLAWFGRNPLGGNGGQIQAMQETFYDGPNTSWPVYYENGVYGSSPTQIGDNQVYNLNAQGAAKAKSTRQFSDVILKQDLGFLLNGLSVRAKVSYNSYIETYQVITKHTLAQYQRSPDSQILYQVTDSSPVSADEWVEKPAEYGNISTGDYNRDLYYEASANYNNKWGRHAVSGLFLFNRRKYNDEAKFPSFEESWASRATYAYADKYLAEFTGGYTGSEKFAPGLRYGFFPAFGVGWVISEENFIKQSSISNILSFAKVKYTYGEVGSDNGAAAFTYSADMSSSNTGPTFGETQAYKYTPAYFEGQTANVNATWETAAKQNLAFELKLINKLKVEVDLFKEHRTGILMSTGSTTPAWFGNEAGDANLGETKTHGYEIALNWRDNISKDFSYFVGGFFTFNENRIVKRNDPPFRADYLKDAGKPISVNRYLLLSDLYRSWNDVYAYPSSDWGNDQRMPGDLAFVDFNADGKVTSEDRASVEFDEIPLHTATSNLGFTYKNISLALNIYGVWGTKKRLPGKLLGGNFWPEAVDRWTPGTAETAQRPRNAGKYGLHNGQTSTYGFEDSGFIRLKSAELSYNIDKAFLEKFGVSNCTLYVNGNNLITFTNFDRRVDPEGASVNTYPLLRRYNVGFRLSF